MDLDSPVYRTILQKMVILMRTVIDFLNRLHDENRNYQRERIAETPLREAIKKATIVPINKVIENPDFLSESKFVAPPSAKPIKPQPKVVWIRYSVSKNEYDLVKDFLGIDKPGDIGHKTFEYFYSREISE
jgi:hypothetical protein